MSDDSAPVVSQPAAASPVQVEDQPTSDLPLPASNEHATSSASDNAPVALATSKRKLHKLLENLTKPPPKRTHDATDSPAKRIRLEARSRLDAAPKAGDASAAIAARVQSQLLRARLDAARRVSGGSAIAEKPPPQEPNYVPWSHEAFLRRLQTFADLRLWTSKPDAVNEVQWAKRGWRCEGVNTVACKGGCEQRVVVALRPKRKDGDGNEIEDSEDYSVDISEGLIARYVDLIVTGHEESCLWRGGGCREDIYRLPIARQVVWQTQLQDRYRSFDCMSASLPPLTRIVHPTNPTQIAALLGAGLHNTKEVASENANHDSTIAESSNGEGVPLVSKPLNPTALAFALTGWRGKFDGPGSAIATCDACFRRLGLWLYASSPEASNGDDEASMSLDLLQNHRDYCPWVNGESQGMPGSLAGLSAWRVLERCIRNEAAFRGVGVASSTIVPTADGEAETESDERPRSREELDQEDKARFAKLRELSRAIGLKGLRSRFKGSRG